MLTADPTPNVFISTAFLYSNAKVSRVAARLTVVTGRSSLTYYEAYRSEQAEARKLNVRLPGTMQKAVLGAVQFRK